MGSYLPSTPAQIQEMLRAIGLENLDELYAAIPRELILKDGAGLPDGMSELEVRRAVSALADKNTVFPTIFRGAGAYRHYIPAIVSDIAAKETFVTAYTPYQAEISQGILQSIFEYQTMICELTQMDASNASLYDGASAAAEAVAMCCERKRTKALVSAAAHPETIEVIRTYAWAAGRTVDLIPCSNGATDLAALEAMLDETVACVYLHQPNFYGILEDCGAAAELAHTAGAKFIMGVNPIAAAVLKTPGECGADIAVGEGQPLGMPLAFGGPYLGFMASTPAMTRKMPGRIVGETVDAEGNRAFVLTLQAREQHIRREKASSNVCSNQALCALISSVYMAVMGPQGLRESAEQSMSKAHYLARELEKLGFTRVHNSEFFHEFVTRCPVDIDALMSTLARSGILGGLPIEMSDGGRGILWCATEMNTRDEIDRLIEIISKEGAR